MILHSKARKEGKGLNINSSYTNKKRMSQKMIKKRGAPDISENTKALKKLKQENKALRETCEILADNELLNSINTSLKEIRSGKGILLSKL